MRTILVLSLTILGTAWTADDAQAFWFRRGGDKYSSSSTSGQIVINSTNNSSSSSGHGPNDYYPNNRGSGYWPGYSNFNLYPGYMSNAGLINGRPASWYSGNSDSSRSR